MATLDDLTRRRRAQMPIERALAEVFDERVEEVRRAAVVNPNHPLLELHERLLGALVDARSASWRCPQTEAHFDNFGMEVRLRQMLYQVRSCLGHGTTTPGPGGTA